MFRTIQARFAGTCRRCGGSIAVGQRMRYGGRGRTYHLVADCGGAAAERDPADEAERRYFRNFDPEYQMEVQGFVSSP
jgi:hypothetical protein